MMDKGKVQRRITFNLDNEIEESLYHEIESHIGPGIDVLVEHYKTFVKDNNPASQINTNTQRYLSELDDYINNTDRLLEILSDKENNKIVHIINGEVLTDMEYKKRVWRPHHELDSIERDRVSSIIYGVKNPDIKKRISLEQLQRYNSSGLELTPEESREQRKQEENMNILRTIFNLQDL